MAEPIQSKPVVGNEQPMRVLLYGDTGSGKTLMTATATRHPAMAPVLYINFDDGLSSVAHVPGIKSIRPTSTNELLVLQTELSKPAAKRAEHLRDIKTVVIDSLSAGRDQILAELVHKGLNKAVNPRTEAVLQIQDYGHMQFALADFVSSLRQQPYHLITTAGVDFEYTADQLTGAKPLLNPKLLQSVNHMMSFIWYASKSNGTYRLLTVEKGIYSIKTRNPRLVRALEVRTMEIATANKHPNPEQMRGWFNLGLDDNDLPMPGLDKLYDLFLQSTVQAEVEPVKKSK